MTTIHANSARDVFARIEVMVLLSGFDIPVQAIREQVCSAVDLIVHQTRGADGKRRIVSIAEVTGMESGVIQTQSLFEWRGSAQTGRFEPCGHLPSFDESLRERGVGCNPKWFEHAS